MVGTAEVVELDVRTVGGAVVITVGGTVTTIGAVVVGATVTATNEGSGEARKANVNSEGFYNFPLLLVGKYSVSVEASGFKKFLQTGDDSALLKFEKKRIVDARRKRYQLLTDLKELERQGSAGVLRFESMYAGSAR